MRLTTRDDLSREYTDWRRFVKGLCRATGRKQRKHGHPKGR